MFRVYELMFILPTVMCLEHSGVYYKQPYGPKMCEDLCPRENCSSFLYSVGNLSCKVFGKGEIQQTPNHTETPETQNNTPGNVSIKDPRRATHRTEKKQPKGYTKFVAGSETDYLKVYYQRKSWLGAQAVCKGDGGNLAKIQDRDKDKSVQLCDKQASVDNHLWIGLKKQNYNDPFLWTDGTPLIYSNWDLGEPSPGSEHCVEITFFMMQYVWYDRVCTANLSFVSEI